MWTCATCGNTIGHPDIGNLIADELWQNGKLVGFVNWRPVHKDPCDPDAGPWHGLDSFTDKHGLKFFAAMRKHGAFSALTSEEIDQLQSSIVRSDFKERTSRFIPFRQWLRRQEKRDDPIGDLARDMSRDPGQSLPNPSLSDLYHYIRVAGACDGALQALIDAYREWQSNGCTYRETRPQRHTKMPKQPRHTPAKSKLSIERQGKLTLRFRILKRDGYRCQICGRTAQDGVKLEIDHKIARSKGGSDTEDNLWTLCFDCNRGKRDIDL
jgi:5-methylcytosine-specific restriction endonuclease McrA